MPENTPDPTQLLLGALDDRWMRYRLELDRCRMDFTEVAVHDVRVALRRLLSLIRLLHSIEPRRRLRRLSRALKDQLDEFDDLRDTQVMLAETSKTAAELPQLQVFQGHLQKAEKGFLKKLRKRLDRLDLKAVARRVRKARESLEAQAGAGWAVDILRSVDEAYLTARQRYARVDPGRPATIHRLRVAFKRFRYMVEIVHPILEDFPGANLKRMNRYQTLMGEIQDAEVFLQALREFQAGASQSDPDPVRRYYESRHTDANSAFLKERDALDDFWRKAPDRPFPWEKEKNE